jgi:hypothetical protein
MALRKRLERKRGSLQQHYYTCCTAIDEAFEHANSLGP